MRAELLAYAADFLRCDLHWLCTGEGGEYVRATNPEFDRLAREIAEGVTRWEEGDRMKFYTIFNLVNRGVWPTFEGVEPARSGR